VRKVHLRRRLGRGLAWEGRAERREDVEISVAEIPDGQRLAVADVLFRTPEHANETLDSTTCRFWLGPASAR
jgi:hypothetical protein